MKCSKCGSERIEVEVAWLVTGQVGGQMETMELAVCQDCGHISPLEASGDDANLS